MAKIQNKTHDTNPKQTSCFLGCFGFSDGKYPEKVRSSSRKKIRWFSWSRFRVKKSGTKTVPIDSAIAETAKQEIEIEVFNPKSNSDNTCLPPTHIQSLVSDQSRLIEKPKKIRHGSERNTILENRKHLEPNKENTSQKPLSLNEVGGSPGTGTKSSTPTAAGISPSVPSPARNREKRTANTATKLKRPHLENDLAVKKFDPMVGMSIVIVTLIIMLLWGRLCAIICTSAWFYFLPLLRRSDDIATNTSSNLVNMDMNSEDYKKKVVLEGFLDRNRRSKY